MGMVDDSLISFNDLPWEDIAPGARQKSIERGNQRIRLVCFSDTFEEEAWCCAGHRGYLLDGEMHINFNGTFKHFAKGDGLWIEKREETKHKVVMSLGMEATLILFEES